VSHVLDERATDFSRERLDRLHQADNIWHRHDCDYDLDAAVWMAEVEADAGIVSTYYFLASTVHYDISWGPARRAAEKVVALGHSVGTHVDLALPRDEIVPDNLLVAACEVQTHRLRSSGLPVERRISFHEPVDDVMWRDIPSFDSAQGSSWVGRYCADSRGAFRYDQPEDMLAALAGTGHTLQLNLHAEWWAWPPEIVEARREEEMARP